MTVVIPNWVGIAMTVLLALIAGITFLNRTSNKADKAVDDTKELKMENRALEAELKQFIKNFNDVFGTVKITLAEQALLNNMSTRTMDTLMNRIEANEKRINDSDTSLRIIHEEIERLKEYTSRSTH